MKTHYDAEAVFGRPRTACGATATRTREHAKVTCLQCRTTGVFKRGPRLTIHPHVDVGAAWADEALRIATWIREQAATAAENGDTPPSLWHVAALVAQGAHRKSGQVSSAARGSK